MSTNRRDDAAPERVPLFQRLFDDIFLLLAAGMIVPTLFYIVWGLISLLGTPEFTR